MCSGSGSGSRARRRGAIRGRAARAPCWSTASESSPAWRWRFSTKVAQVTTIEGLGADGELHPLQQAFIEHDGFQCGYCTPGQICSAVGMAEESRRGVPSQVTGDLLSAVDHAHSRRATRAHERQPVPLRCAQRDRRRDRRGLRAGRSRMIPFTYRPCRRRRDAVRLARRRGRQVSRRRHQPGRPDARDDRAARGARRRHRPLERDRGD